MLSEKAIKVLEWSLVYILCWLTFMALCGCLEAQVWLIIALLLGGMAANDVFEAEEV